MKNYNNKPKATVTADIAAVIKKDLIAGVLYQHEIAAKHGVNQGRISEIARGKRFAEVPPAN